MTRALVHSECPARLGARTHLQSAVAVLPVVEVQVIGSTVDAWSDLDVVTVARNGHAGQLFPDRSWLEGLGGMCAYSQSEHRPGGVTRLVFDDGRRLDVIVTDEGHRDERLHGLRHPAVTVDRDTVVNLANQVLFDAAIAVGKAARDERLVAAHLTVGLARASGG